MEKLFKLQQEIGKISKTATNPFFKSKYFDINQLLEQLQPLLEKHNLLVLQPLVNVAMRPAIRTIIYDISKKETLIASEITLPDLPDPQKMGSAITYYRRYSLQSLLGLQAEDDDGNLGSGKTNQSSPKAEPVNPVKLVVPVDKRKEKIADLCKKLGIKDKEYGEFVYNTTNLVLKETNFNEIIDRLELQLN